MKTRFSSCHASLFLVWAFALAGAFFTPATAGARCPSRPARPPRPRAADPVPREASARPAVEPRRKKTARPADAPPKKKAKKISPAARAEGKDRPRIAILNTGEVTLASVTELLKLYQGLSSQKLGQPIAEGALRKALAGQPRDPVRLKAKAALEQGRLLYGSLKLAAATKSLRRAEALYLSHVPMAKGRSGLRDTWVYLLLTYNSLGERKKAVQIARRLKLLTRSSKPPAGIPASLWRKLTARLPTRRATRRLSVEAPAEAKVWVDFQALPAPPAKKKESEGAATRAVKVDASRHHVIVEADGHRKFYQRVAAGHRPATVTAVLAPRSGDPYAKLRAELTKIRRSRAGFTQAALRSLCQRVDVDRLLVAAQTKSGWALRLFRSEPGQLVAGQLTVSFPATSKDLEQVTRWSHRLAAQIAKEDEEARQAAAKKKKARQLPLKESARKAAARVAEPKVPTKKKKKEPTPVWERWYFWVAIGAVGIVTAVFALRKEESDKVEIRVYRPSE